MSDEYVHDPTEDEDAEDEVETTKDQVQDDCKTPDQTRLFLKTKQRELQNQIGDAESEIAKQNLEAESLKKKKDMLDAEYAVIDQILTDFEAKEEDINCELEKIENYVKKAKKQFHEGGLRKKMREAIQDIRDQIDDAIVDLQERVDALDEKEYVYPEDDSTVLRAENYLDNCTLILNDKQQAYDDVKNCLSKSEKSLTELSETITNLEQQIEAGELRNAYVHYLDLKEKSETTRAEFDAFKDGPPSELLCNAWIELDAASKQVRQAEQILNGRKNESSNGHSLLTGLQTSRIDDIFDKIKAGDPVISI